MKAFLEFETAETAAAALRKLTALGHAGCETYGPFPLTKEDADAPRSSFPLPLLAFGAGATALGAAYMAQWYANVRSYPLNIGGRPAHAAPAFIPATFESVCLLAAVALFLGFLLFERLPRLWQPIFEIEGFERASIDRFWIAFDVGSGRDLPDDVRRDVVPLDPVRIVIGDV
jgi:hypothetical protein